jgi:formate hydrogenlyase transcriptional activator
MTLRILHLEDDPLDVELLREVLRADGFDFTTTQVDTEDEFRNALAAGDLDLILADYSLPSFDGLSALKMACELTPDIPFILVSGQMGEERAIESLKAGATDYVLKQRLSRLGPAVKRALAEAAEQRARRQAEEGLKQVLSELQDMKDKLQAENLQLRQEIRSVGLQKEIIGQSRILEEVLVEAEQVAATDSTVLVLGETGTGKELLARAIHRMGPRFKQPLVVVNCAAIPHTLVESELFGHVKGAFTGAAGKKVGRFELAHKSTIFLDEVGELDPPIQAKLLRVLQEGKFEQLGSSKTLSVDVRVIAATNRNLEQAVAEGTFRNDLFYRLNVFPLTLPPLRDRTEDIPLLVAGFVEEFCEKMGKRVDQVSRRSMEALMVHPWPGNVRELRNVVERAMIMARSSTIEIPLPEVRTSPGQAALNTLADVERAHVLSVLNRTGWKIRGENGAAEILDLKPTTLESRIARLGLKRPSD